MQKQNWSAFVDVSEQKYMKEVFNVIQSRTKPIHDKINPVYYMLCCNKLVAVLAS